jgi:hypothetical protein
MTPRQIARLLSEDVQVNNGLLFEAREIPEAMKLTLVNERGRNQTWDLDGVKVTSLAGEGHVEASHPVIDAFIRGEYDQFGIGYPRVGETVELPKIMPDEMGHVHGTGISWPPTEEAWESGEEDPYDSGLWDTIPDDLGGTEDEREALEQNYPGKEE